MPKKTRQRQLEKLARRRAEERSRRRRQRMLIGVVAGAIAVTGIGLAAWAFLGGDDQEAPAAESEAAPTPEEEDAMQGAPPEMQLDDEADYRATMETSQGTVVLDLYEDLTPITVNNFVALARDGFYDGLIFHRVIEGFMIQGGDPQGDGTGGPGYTFEDEIVDGITFEEPGLLAMANSGPDTNGSQFFITVAPTPHLDGLHTIFGRVIDGMDVVRSVSRVETDDQDRPVEPVVIESIAVEEA
jgi:peptidyl-prolyl cis-trans isomerase A (cyclophilin A)